MKTISNVASRGSSQLISQTGGARHVWASVLGPPLFASRLEQMFGPDCSVNHSSYSSRLMPFSGGVSLSACRNRTHILERGSWCAERGHHPTLKSGRWAGQSLIDS